MTKKELNLSPVEWSLMKICWKKGKTTAREIFEESLKEKERGYQTVKTMLDRMTVKGALKREKFGPIYLYQPTVSETRGVASAIESFLSHVLDDNLTPLFSYFAKGKNLSPEEIEQLKKLIQEREEKK